MILSRDELLKESPELAAQACIRPLSSPGAQDAQIAELNSGMLIMAAAPVFGDDGQVLAVLYGGKLLNNNNAIVDKARDIIFQNERYKDKDVGAVTIFQNDLRIATSIRTTSGERAIGTLVSPRVYQNVLVGGDIFNKVEFAVNDWYITAYEPIKDISGNIIGILGLSPQGKRRTAITSRSSLPIPAAAFQRSTWSSYSSRSLPLKKWAGERGWALL